MSSLYDTEKINKKIDITEILKMQDQIKKMQEQLIEVTDKNQYNKYLEIRANTIPKLEELERKIDEIGGIDYILNTITSKEYHLKALLEEFEIGPRLILGFLTRFKLSEEDDRYSKAQKMYQRRISIRSAIEWNLRR